ncbi:MAG: ACT domain-containing protein, partial [Terriglobia bacterium]
IDRIRYEEMLELAATGAKVLELRAAEYGRLHGVSIHVRSSFVDEPGTIIEEGTGMEKAIVTGITYDAQEAKITILGVPDKPGIAARVFSALAEADVNVDMIIQNVGEKGSADISFTVPKDDLVRAESTIGRVAKELEARGTNYTQDIAKVSLIGAGMRTHPGVAADMFAVLADRGINIQMISTSSIKISCVISADQVETAIRALHRQFELDKEPVEDSEKRG